MIVIDNNTMTNLLLSRVVPFQFCCNNHDLKTCLNRSRNVFSHMYVIYILNYGIKSCVTSSNKANILLVKQA